MCTKARAQEAHSRAVSVGYGARVLARSSSPKRECTQGSVEVQYGDEHAPRLALLHGLLECVGVVEGEYNELLRHA